MKKKPASRNAATPSGSSTPVVNRAKPPKKSSHPPGCLATTPSADSREPMPLVMTAPVLDMMPPSLAGMSHEEIMVFDTICQHEIARAMMLRLVKQPATKLWATPLEGAYQARTEKPMAVEDTLLITLAGCAFKLGIFTWPANWRETRDPGMDEARAILGHWSARFIFEHNTVRILSVEEALERWLRKAAEMLCLHDSFILETADILMAKGTLSAGSFAAMLRNYDRQLKEQGLDRMLHLNHRRCDPDERQCGWERGH